MNKKQKIAYVCNSCGEDFPKWMGKCTSCGEWDSISEINVTPSAPFSRTKGSSVVKSEVVSLTDCVSATPDRINCRFTEIDRVLGGGLVKGAFLLLGGDPGIGKSTLLLQLASFWAQGGASVLYVSGEESASQLSMRALRLGIRNSTIKLITETCMESVLETVNSVKPSIVVIDSIQTMFTNDLESAPGSVSQIRESAAILLRMAKTTATSVLLIGHVTKEGAIAGPRILEHMVDTVLYFEGESSLQYRIVRAVKNRFGPSGEIALLGMSDSGLFEIANASEFFLMNRHIAQTGTSMVAVLEGSRILVVELQALVNQSHFGIPQRVASGINPKRLSLLLAVLERHGGVVLGNHDIFFNIAGGLTISEPAIDLGIAASVLSSFRNRPLRKDLACIGELGLGGEIRPVSNMGGRLRELAHMGFKECVVTKPVAKADWAKIDYGMKLLFCDNVRNLPEMIF